MCKAQLALLYIRQEQECDNGVLFGLFEEVHAPVANKAAPRRPEQHRRHVSSWHHTISDDASDASDASSTSSSRVSASQKRTAKESSPEPQSQRQVKKQRRGRGASSTTVRGFQRIVIEHSYRDNSQATEEPDETTTPEDEEPLSQKCHGGITTTFPVLLHKLLEDAQGAGFSDVVNWLPHGRAFLVFDQQRFVTEVMPRYFRQTRFRSFQRQLSLYGFLRLTRKGSECGAYYHELCLRGMPFLCKRIQRHRVKGWMVRQAASPETEPNFWDMPAVGIPDPTPLAEPAASAAAAEAAASVSSSCLQVETPPQVGRRNDPLPPNRADSEWLSCLSDFCFLLPTWDATQHGWPPVPSSPAETLVQAIRHDDGVWLASQVAPPAGIGCASGDLTLDERGDWVSFLGDVDLDTSEDDSYGD